MKVGVFGATSMVGQGLLPLLAEAGYRVIAYSRSDSLPAGCSKLIEYRTLTKVPQSTPEPENTSQEEIAEWVCLAPIWTLQEHFPMLERCHARRIVVLGSTSIFTKESSFDPAEREIVERLSRGEDGLAAWADAHSVEWVVLRPTLIYGRGQDRNICEIARFITRFGFFPLFGKAHGLRQPIHADDVAAATVAALVNKQVRNRAYNLSGAETLTYRDMVSRVFTALGRPVRFVTIPLLLFRAAIICLRIFPRFRKWSAAMAERMNRDLLFDHTEATRDFGFAPRHFVLGETDVAGGRIRRNPSQ